MNITHVEADIRRILGAYTDPIPEYDTLLEALIGYVVRTHDNDLASLDGRLIARHNFVRTPGVNKCVVCNHIPGHLIHRGTEVDMP